MQIPSINRRFSFTSDRNRGRESGFTLLELLVALALAAIVSLLISVVGSQAQNIYEATTAQVEVYQKFRYALSDLQDHLQNWENTTDLEFFVDSQGESNGHWEEGEEIRLPENLDGGRPNYYDEGAHIIESKYIVEQGGVEEEHDNFSIYFKAPSNIGGAIRMCNIEYYLGQPVESTEGKNDGGLQIQRVPEFVENNRNLVLLRVIRYVDIDDSNFFKRELKVKTKTTELCQNVTDLRFEYYFDNTFDNRPGGFFTPSREQELLPRNREAPPSRPKGLPPGSLMKEFLYGGFRDFGGLSRGVANIAIRDSQRAQFKPVFFSIGGGTSIKFSQLHYGDNIYLWTDGDLGDFRRGNYTVFRNENGRVEFQESIDSSNWDGNASGIRYRAGFVPDAIRVTIRVLNDAGEEPRKLTVVVHPFRKK